MKSDRVIESAIRPAQNLLWQNLPPTHKLPDTAAVARLRDLVRSPAVKSALLHSNDTFLAFVLRAVEFVLADQFRADREIIHLIPFGGAGGRMMAWRLQEHPAHRLELVVCRRRRWHRVPYCSSG